VLAHPDANFNAPTSPLGKLIFVIQHIGHLDKITTILGFTSLGFLIFARVFKKVLVQRPGGQWLRFVPEILLVVASTTGKLFYHYMVADLPSDPKYSHHRYLQMGLAGRFCTWQNRCRIREPIRHAIAEKAVEVLQLHSKPCPSRL
jgi:hypothetical protein